MLKTYKYLNVDLDFNLNVALQKKEWNDLIVSVNLDWIPHRLEMWLLRL